MDSTPGDPRSVYVPAGSILDRWMQSAWEGGIRIDHLRDLQSLKVRTLNSLYELRIVSASDCMVLLRGGQFFPELTPAQFSGSTFGGSLIKMKSIYAGMRMEFHLGGLNRFTTSPVQWIGQAEDPDF